MNIQHPQNNLQKNITCIGFQGYKPTHVVKFYRQLDDKFITNTRQKGVGKNALLAIIESLAQNPKFEFKTFNEIKNELSQKIKQILQTIDNSNNMDELKNSLRLPIETISTLICKRQQALRNEKIAEAFYKGEKLGELAKKFNLKPATIEQILRSLGISLDLRAVKTNMAIDMLKKGVSKKEVSEVLGLNPATIQAIRRKANIPSERKQIAITKHTQIVEALKAGQNHRDIANKFKISKSKIDELAIELGTKSAADKTLQTIMQKLQERNGVMQIAKELNLSIPEVLRQVRTLEFTPQDARALREGAILEALKTKRVIDVAKEFNVAINTVYNIKRKYHN